MAQIMQVKLVDDLDGGQAAESLAFSQDGKSNEIDLSDTHAAALRDAFAPFITNARRAGSGPKVVPAADVDANGSGAWGDGRDP